MNNTDIIKDVLERASVLLAWGPGYDALHAAPLFAREARDADKIITDVRAVQNLATYLPALFQNEKEGRVAVLARPCHVRSITELLQEELIPADRLILVVLPCQGKLDLGKVMAACPAAESLDAAFVEGENLVINADGRQWLLRLESVLSAPCVRCAMPLLPDEMIPEGCECVRLEGAPRRAGEGGYAALDAFMKKTPRERWEFWKKEMSRCIRCYACRNACPMCVCRDHCVASSRDPHWLTELDSVTDKLLFQVIHAMHLAGRCTGCGECGRACPMGIPVGLLKMQMNKIVEELFDYKAGPDSAATPPLLTFNAIEKNIREKGK